MVRWVGCIGERLVKSSHWQRQRQWRPKAQNRFPQNAPGEKAAFRGTICLFIFAFAELRTMAKGKGKKKVEVVFLVCDETGDHNYVLRRKPGGEKLKIKKYCPRLRRHTLHSEKKK